jgi:hypothetical protein
MNMSQALRKDWIPKLQARYAGRGREGKSRMLDELCQDYEYERKYAIKLLGGSLPGPSGKARPGREPQYEMIEPVVLSAKNCKLGALRRKVWPSQAIPKQISSSSENREPP